METTEGLEHEGWRERSYLHVRMRFWSRFRIDIDRGDYNRLEELVRSGRISPQTKRLSRDLVFHVRFKGRLVGLVWNRRHHRIVTVIPPSRKDIQ